MSTVIDNADRQNAIKRSQTELFALFFRSYVEAGDATRKVIRDMAEIINDSGADEAEKASALSTLMEAMFPSNAPDDMDGELGIDLRDFREVQDDEEQYSAHDREEKMFSDRLRLIMDEKKITQTALAKLIDVGQPAIANMLARKCRPQRRTVEKIAEALGVPPQKLWPDF